MKGHEAKVFKQSNMDATETKDDTAITPSDQYNSDSDLVGSPNTAKSKIFVSHVVDILVDFLKKVKVVGIDALFKVAVTVAAVKFILCIW